VVGNSTPCFTSRVGNCPAAQRQPISDVPRSEMALATIFSVTISDSNTQCSEQLGLSDLFLDPQRSGDQAIVLAGPRNQLDPER
jgi:hypothetical protein